MEHLSEGFEERPCKGATDGIKQKESIQREQDDGFDAPKSATDQKEGEDNEGDDQKDDAKFLDGSDVGGVACGGSDAFDDDVSVKESVQKQRQAEADIDIKDIATKGVGNGVIVISAAGIADRDNGVRDAGCGSSDDYSGEKDGYTELCGEIDASSGQIVTGECDDRDAYAQQDPSAPIIDGSASIEHPMEVKCEQCAKQRGFFGGFEFVIIVVVFRLDAALSVLSVQIGEVEAIHHHEDRTHPPRDNSTREHHDQDDLACDEKHSITDHPFALDMDGVDALDGTIAAFDAPKQHRDNTERWDDHSVVNGAPCTCCDTCGKAVTVVIDKQQKEGREEFGERGADGIDGGSTDAGREAFAEVARTDLEAFTSVHDHDGCKDDNRKTDEDAHE